ncbi:Stk1 family PASTA domain-containing Ser/Thr kinase [Dysosmobacter sp.]|uniref:Stk1 family PASTA domain-containing Ser/Thr kinase n=1 Tax=Dysosmobacter sp. TaxID=2591382 RepID=UPI002A83834B|nr:Stk1 family PASTA domain-containing Ser/Thr kinase [Dysosmobacter sp.]MCI7216024.1 Stk1 family PASTA domain-containing Ser/Thr kinase [Dysosmobacter sp.]MDY3653306.1 Stk1 family PASTA domain-containing Ser/Thr kinase [Dysosmobacter sp.]
MDQYIGKMLDNRYEILERIGTGGMAIVYKAKCHRLNRLVAIKILKSDLAQNEEFRRRFNAESQAVAQLSHPNIVSVYDVSRGGDMEYIVMELIDGITLKQYMEKRGQLNWRESLHFITQIMRGLSHAHSRGIIHRDIKPQNIMVLRDGSVKVADFGIACLADSAQTLTQEALGSVHYISPEQARGDRPDARSDIYSSGVVLYEMLTGRLPFEGESAVSVAIQHLSSIPLAPREINPDIPEQLELICMKAMAPDLEHRYQSADAMIADLEAFRKNPEVEMKFDLSDLRPEENDEPTRTIRTMPSHTVTIPVHQPERNYPHRERDEDEEPRRAGSGKRGVLVGAVTVAAVAVVIVLFKTILGSFAPAAVDQYQVPDLYNMTIEEAENDPRIEGVFEIQKAGSEFSADVPEGHILRQDPKKEETRKGSQLVIQVWVSAGEETGEVPDLENKSEQDARILLEKLNKEYNLELTVEAPEELKQFSEEITEGYVIKTEPAQGEILKKGDTVKLILSKGPDIKPVTVLPFVGMSIDSVLSQLESYKLTCDAADVEVVDSDKPGGTIVWQSPASGETVPEWTTIKFRVSAGLASSALPITVDIPQNGKDIVKVEIYVGDEPNPQYSETVYEADGAVSTTLYGTGRKMVKVYFDGVLDQKQSYERSFD